MNWKHRHKSYQLSQPLQNKNVNNSSYAKSKFTTFAETHQSAKRLPYFPRKNQRAKHSLFLPHTCGPHFPSSRSFVTHRYCVCSTNPPDGSLSSWWYHFWSRSHSPAVARLLIAVKTSASSRVGSKKLPKRDPNNTFKKKKKKKSGGGANSKHGLGNRNRKIIKRKASIKYVSKIGRLRYRGAGTRLLVHGEKSLAREIVISW